MLTPDQQSQIDSLQADIDARGVTIDQLQAQIDSENAAIKDLSGQIDAIKTEDMGGEAA